MKKRGITLISATIAITVMIILISTISISITYSVANAKKMTFAKEIYNVQSLVTEYIEKEEAIPNTKEAITINLENFDDEDLIQFDGETIVEDKVNLNVLDLTDIDVKNTNYGNKSIGKDDVEKAKDVYAASDTTGKVYYIAGFESQGNKYYTLTEELRQMIEKNQNLNISEKTIVFTPSKVGWTNVGITVNVFVPVEFESPSITINNSNISYSTSSDAKGTYYIVNNTKIKEDFVITVNYTKNDITGSATYQTKLDDKIPTISKDASVSNTKTEVRGLNAADDESGIRHFKYAEGVIKAEDVKQYMRVYGKKINKGKIKFRYQIPYTIYAEDKAGNYKVMYIDKNGDLVDEVPPDVPPILAPGDTWYDPSFSRTPTKIQFVDKVDSTIVTKAEDSWPAAVDLDGDGKNDNDIMCYINDDSDSGATILTIAGNGYGEIIANEDSSYAFSFSDIGDIEGLEILNTGNVTNMQGMFYDCDMMIGFSLEYFNMENVTDMSYMFADCDFLETVRFENVSTSNVKDMSHMFENCEYLEELYEFDDLSTASVKDMSYMFRGCTVLEEIDVSNFDVSSVIDISYMFADCEKLPYANMNGWNLESAENMSHMFDNCKELLEAYMNGWVLKSAENMSYMFANCVELLGVYMNNWKLDTSEEHKQDMSYMFKNCESLVSFCPCDEHPTNAGFMGWGYIETTEGMFDGCKNLVEVDISNLGLAEDLYNTSYMFRECVSLEKLRLCNQEIAPYEAKKMFYNCNRLKYLDLRYLNTYWIEYHETIDRSDLEAFAYDCRSCGYNYT